MPECSSGRTATSRWQVTTTVTASRTWRYSAEASGTGSTRLHGSFSAEQFGIDTDIPVHGDYNGDNRDDIAVFRPSTGNWYFHISGDRDTFSGLHWGQSGDIPVPGDYDGDNLDDVAVYRGGTWYINGTMAGQTTFPFGTSSDLPVPKMYIR